MPTPRAYAEDTSVPATRSQAQIQDVVREHGGKSFMFGVDDVGETVTALVAFTLQERQVRFVLPMPQRTEQRFTHTPSRNNRRSAADAERAWEQGTRAQWRALYLVIRAKLEAVAVGIVTFEEEFLAQLVLPGGDTVYQHVAPRLAEAYAGGSAPALLPGLGETP